MTTTTITNKQQRQPRQPTIVCSSLNGLNSQEEKVPEIIVLSSLNFEERITHTHIHTHKTSTI